MKVDGRMDEHMAMASFIGLMVIDMKAGGSVGFSMVTQS